MFVAPCPHCQDPVTVPSRARPTSRVRCPLCTEVFTLDEMMSKLPPALELLDEPMMGYGSGAEYAAHEGGDSDVATLVATGSEGEMSLAEAEPRAERPDYLGDSGSDTATKTPRKSVRSTPRPKRKPKNPVLEVIKVVLGGLMAFPISVGILWAAGRDPFELAPTVVEYAPFMANVIPEKLQKKPKEPSEKKQKPAVEKPSNEKKRPAGLPKLENAEIPSLDLPDNSTLDPGPTLTPDNPLSPKIDFEPVPEPTEDPMDKKTSTLDPPPIEPVPEPTPPAAEPVVRDAPRYTAAEVEEAAKSASNAMQAWTEGSKEAGDDEKKNLMRSLYIAYAQLGEKFAYANPADKGLENHIPAVRETLFALQPEPELMSMISRVGPAWLNPTTRKSDGVVLIGTVKQVVASGKLFETRLELADAKKTTVSVISTQDPAQSYAAENKAMVLGVIVSEPSNIVGYEGDAPLAILSGMAVRVAE